MPNWPVGTRSKGNEGVTAAIKTTPNSIGYVEYGYAKSQKLASPAGEQGRSLCRGHDGIGPGGPRFGDSCPPTLSSGLPILRPRTHILSSPTRGCFSTSSTRTKKRSKSLRTFSNTALRMVKRMRSPLDTFLCLSGERQGDECASDGQVGALCSQCRRGRPSLRASRA